MGVRLPDPPSSSDPSAFRRWAAQFKQAVEQEITNLQNQNLMPTFSGTGTTTTGVSHLPSAQLPSRWIYVVGTATSGPAWNNGTTWFWPGTGAVAVY